ncbi:BT1 family [Roseovarius mucosus DSM 17069]|uniref:BT1 family n=1 Tax=Roseovarius mucosus DSM 17069 TaxID=1288298 RepID=A0A0A0HPY3_9RHOB|nr:membrane protein [Roseovarius mucosus]KGM89877.1 BT1 family [Roseovarius mucosus DSM 17069]
MTLTQRLMTWADAVVFDLGRQMRWTFLPPLMVYFAAGFSGLTMIVGTFFVKEYLDLSAAYLAGLAFWAGLPWALKMPLGHLVDIIWRWKWLLIYLGAGLIGLSVLIMYLLLTQTEAMVAIMPMAAWYVTSYILAPCGLVIQDAVADAMSVEAVPRFDAEGRAIDVDTARALHTTMQTLGRFALISGTLAVAALNIYMFAGIEDLGSDAKRATYALIYFSALSIPLVSVSGVLLAAWQKHRLRRGLRQTGLSEAEADTLFERPGEETRANPWYFIGGAGFVALSLSIGLSEIPYGQEIIFAGSMAIVLLLMRQLVAVLPVAQARTLVGTAIIIFMFRATPRPGDGYTWFSIDLLAFDQQFLSVLSLITSVLTLVGMVILRPLMAHRSIVYIVVLLTLAGGVLSLPNIGLYYGVQEVTAAMTGGIVDARFIAILDTAIESPLGQVAMIPMLAWIARNAPDNLKATFFAVMASFTNLALSASSLLTKYLNQVFVVTREVKDAATGQITTAADYSALGTLLITVTLITVGLPLLTVVVIQRSPLRSKD